MIVIDNQKLTQLDIFFTSAKLEDIPVMVEIEKEYFGSYGRFYNEEFMLKWYRHNPDMFYVIKTAYDEILGFTIITPVTKKLYEDIRSGKVGDLFDFPESEVPRDFVSDYFFVSDVVASREKCKSNIMAVKLRLQYEIINVLFEVSKKVLTSSASEEGLRAMQASGFEEVAREEFEGLHIISELIVTKEKYQELMERFKIFLESDNIQKR